MSNEMEDRIGKFLMILVFSVLLFWDLQRLVALFAARDLIDLWSLAMVSKISSIIFISAVVYFTVIRHNPVSSAAGFLPRLTAVAGTFVMMALIALPSFPISRPMQIFSTCLIVIGTTLSIICLRRLGRSFSIMASARELVTHGPYNIVRHPLYCAELITIVGVAFAHGSILSFVVAAVWWGLQIQRARFEEATLRAAFPAYEDYAREVPMMVPNLVRLFQSGADAKAVAKQPN
jgi:protein-S-isoprenylcysteine O-methyltransferase Ste14